MEKKTNLSDTSMAAMNAIDKISEKKFQELQYVQQCFIWTCYYFNSDIIDKPTTDLTKLGADPRNIYYVDKKDDSFIKFVGQYNSIQQFIIIGDNLVPVNMDIIAACDEYIEKCDTSTGEIKYDESRIASIFGGLKFLNKFDMFKKMMNEIYNTSEIVIEKTNKIINDLIHKNIQELERFFKVSKETIESKNSYIICYSTSYATPDLKQKYLETKEKYLKMLDELYEIIRNSPALSVCYNNACVQDVSASKAGVAYVDVKQVVNCSGEVISDEIVKDTSNGDLDVAVLKAEFENLKSKFVGKDDIIKLIEDKLDKKLEEERKKVNIGVGTVIILIILFIICLCALVLGIKNTMDINRKLNIPNTVPLGLNDGILTDDDLKRLN